MRHARKKRYADAMCVSGLYTSQGVTIYAATTCVFVQMGRLGLAPHPNIIQQVGPGFLGPGTEDVLCLPLELCVGGDVMDAVQKSGHLPLAACQHVFSQAAAALVHCHALGVYHLDVKPENLFLTCKDVTVAVVKLGDFGRAVCEENRYGCMATHRPGTSVYAAPETYVPGFDVVKVDTWALAVSMLVSAVGLFPWELACVDEDKSYRAWASVWRKAEGPATRREALRRLVTDAAAECAAAQLPDLFLDLCVAMLDPRPETRLGMADVAAHAWWQWRAACGCS